MKYFIFEVCWSQTDHDKIIVKANSKAEAEKILVKSPLNPHHFNYNGEANLGIYNEII